MILDGYSCNESKGWIKGLATYLSCALIPAIDKKIIKQWREAFKVVIKELLVNPKIVNISIKSNIHLTGYWIILKDQTRYTFPDMTYTSTPFRMEIIEIWTYPSLRFYLADVIGYDGMKELEKYSTASSRCSSRERLYLLSFR